MPTIKLVFSSLAAFTASVHAQSSAPNAGEDSGATTLLFLSYFKPSVTAIQVLQVSQPVVAQYVTRKVLKRADSWLSFYELFL